MEGEFAINRLEDVRPVLTNLQVDNATCADTVYNAIKTGYRLFDGACGMFLLWQSNSSQFKTSRAGF